MSSGVLRLFWARIEQRHNHQMPEFHALTGFD
jgi:hypothetical protein